jgi:hypothetical protein
MRSVRLSRTLHFFGYTFEGVVAWGLMFLLPANVQATVIPKVAEALNRRRQVSLHVAASSPERVT